MCVGLIKAMKALKAKTEFPEIEGILLKTATQSECVVHLKFAVFTFFLSLLFIGISHIL